MARKEWYQSQLFYAALSPVLGAIITGIFDVFKNLPLLSTLGSILESLWKHLIFFLTLRITIWIFILSIAVLLLVRYMVRKVLRLIKPAFLDFKEKEFKGFYFRWDYKRIYRYSRYFKEWVICNLAADCPKCSTPMKNFKDQYLCPRCEYFTVHSSGHEIKTLIEEEIKKIKNSQPKIKII